MGRWEGAKVCVGGRPGTKFNVHEDYLLKKKLELSIKAKI